MSALAPPQSPSLSSSFVLPQLARTADQIQSSLARQQNQISSLHLINGEHFSGAERVQQILGKCLPGFGVSANFVCLKADRFPGLCGLDADRVCSIKMSSRFDLSIVRRIVDYAYEIQADVFHAHTPRTAMIASFAAKLCRLPWVYHVHSPTARDSTRAILNYVNNWVETYSLRNANHIITVSKSLRREMLSKGHTRHKVTAVANGVAEQIPIEPRDRLEQNHWRLGMVALVRPRKGIEVLLEAIAMMGSDRSRISLEVIGGFETTDYETSVRQLIARLGLERTVHLRGFSTDVPSVMRTFDAMVLPSLFGEGMPMVVLEALACGVPVIATDVEGTPEVVRDGKEGMLAKPQDAISLSKVIRKFIANRNVWCGMSGMAVERHRNGFSDHIMAKRTAQVYRKLTEAR